MPEAPREPAAKGSQRQLEEEEDEGEEEEGDDPVRGAGPFQPARPGHGLQL